MTPSTRKRLGWGLLAASLLGVASLYLAGTDPADLIHSHTENFRTSNGSASLTTVRVDEHGIGLLLLLIAAGITGLILLLKSGRDTPPPLPKDHGKP